MCLSIPPKLVVSSVAGYTKGKSAITIARRLIGREKNFTARCFGREAFISTIALDEEMVRAYIRYQESEDERYDQMNLKTIARRFQGGTVCRRL